MSPSRRRAIGAVRGLASHTPSRAPSPRPIVAPCALELLKIFVFLYNPLKRSLCSFVLKPTAPLPVAARYAGYALLILRSFVRPPRGRNMRYLLPRDSLALIPRLSMLRPTSRVVALAPLRWPRCALASRPVRRVRRVRPVRRVFGSRCAGSALLILRTFVRPLQGRNIRYALPRDSLRSSRGARVCHLKHASTLPES